MPRDDRRQQIIDSAIHTFGEKGFRAATTAELAKHAGISEALLYQHFSSKVELLNAVVQHLGQQIYAGLQEVLMASTDPSVTMRQLFESFSGFYQENPQVARFGLNLIAELDDEESLATVRKILEDSADLLTRALKNGQDHGVIRSDIRPELLAWNVISVYQTYGVLMRLNLQHNMNADTAIELATPFLATTPP